MRSVVFAAMALAAAISLASPARANGRYPAAGQVLLAPDDAKLLVVRATFGILISHDRGASWGWVCEGAAGYGNSQEDPPLALTLGHALLVATQEGLAVSSDTGCAWALHPELGAPFVDLVSRQDDAHGAFAIAAPAGPEADGGGATYESALYQTTDDGAHFRRASAAFDADVILETVEVARSDAKRVYVSGVRYGATTTTGVLYVSTDGGARVTAHTFPLGFDDLAPYVAAVDPTNADRVYLRVEGPAATRLFVSDDGGKTVKAVYTTKGPMLGFALTGDGSRVYLGGLDDGLLAAPRDTLEFTPVSPVPIQCLTTRGDDVYACSTDQAGGFAVGVSTDGGGSFTALLHVGCVGGPLACGADSPEAACVAGWPAVKTTLAVCPRDEATEGGAPPVREAGAPTLDPPLNGSPRAASSGGCQGARSGPFAGPAAGGPLSVFLLLMRLRRVRRTRGGAGRARGGTPRTFHPAEAATRSPQERPSQAPR